MIGVMDVDLTEESLSGSWLSSRLGVGTRRLDAMRRAGELLGVRRPGGQDFLYPAWQFAPDGKPLPVIERLVRAGRGAGLSDERLYEVLVARTGISGDARLADAIRQGKDEYVLSVVRGASMALVSLNAVRKSFGSRTVLDGLDFAIEPRARVGVIGANGSGKSTMLRLIAGLEEPDAGTSVRRRGIVVSFLPQHPLGDDRNALETVRAARPDLDELDRDLPGAPSSSPHPSLPPTSTRWHASSRARRSSLERWEAAGGPSFDGRARAMLLDLGLDEETCLPTRALSGGQRKLIALAACLARDPDVLLLDEPEAHLDAVGRSLLERLIATSTAPSSPSRTTATCSTRPSARSPSSTAAGSGCGPATTRRTARARARAAAAAGALHDAAEGDRAARGGDPALPGLGPQVVDERHIKQARNKQRQIDRMEKIERPVLERRKIALAAPARCAAASASSSSATSASQFGEDPVLPAST